MSEKSAMFVIDILKSIILILFLCSTFLRCVTMK